MKIASFLFIVLINCSTLFACQVEVTKLTDENFDPLPKEIHVFYHGSIEIYNKYHYSLEDKQITTITLVFKFNEIGKDYDAVVELYRCA